MKKGFTLVELLVVIAIIALLLAIVVPSLQRARELALRITCASNQRSTGLATLMYGEDEDDQLPPVRNRPGHQRRRHNHLHRYWWVLSGSTPDEWRDVSAAHGVFWNLGTLWQTGYVDVGEIFYCFSRNVHPDFQYEHYNDPVFPVAKQPAFGTGTTSVRMSYSYNPENVGNTREEERVPVHERRSTLLSTTVLITDNINAAGPPHSDGWNVVYGDGSVSYFRDDELQRIVTETPRFNMDGPEQWRAWDEVIRRMKGH